MAPKSQENPPWDVKLAAGFFKSLHLKGTEKGFTIASVLMPGAYSQE